MLETIDLVNQIVAELKDENDSYFREISWWNLEEELEEREIPFEVVHTSFEEGGRWSNYYERVVKIYDDYIQISESVPATEMQDGDGITDIVQVYPKQVTKTIYVTNKG